MFWKYSNKSFLGPQLAKTLVSRGLRNEKVKTFFSNKNERP